MHIDGPNVKPPREISEATAREELAQQYEARAARFALGTLHHKRIAVELRARAAEIRKGKTNE